MSDIYVIASGENIENGSSITHIPPNIIITNDDRAVNTPDISSISGKYSDRFKDE